MSLICYNVSIVDMNISRENLKYNSSKNLINFTLYAGSLIGFPQPRSVICY